MAIVDTAGAWGDGGSLGDEWRREFLLSTLGCALIMTGRDIVPGTDRDWFYHVAQLATAQYLGKYPDQSTSTTSPAPVQSPSAAEAVENRAVEDRTAEDRTAEDRTAVGPGGANPVMTVVLPAGTRLWRVHPRSARTDEFVTEPTGRLAVMYASRRQITALLEELLRGVPYGEDGERDLAAERLLGKRLSVLRTTRDLVLACADGEPDLVGLRPPEGVHGIEWPSASDLPEPTTMLLEQRCPDGAIRPEADHAIDLDDQDQAAWLRESLRPYRVRVLNRPAPNPLVFVISYPVASSEASRLLAAELRTRLSDTAVFDHDQSLAPGVNVAAARHRNLCAAKVLLVVLGKRGGMVKNWRGIVTGAEGGWHQQVCSEVSEALGNGVRVVPVLVAQPERALRALPEGLLPLARLQPLRLPDQYTRQDIQTLVARLLQDVPLLADAERGRCGA
jgi:hypothetical protein